MWHFSMQGLPGCMITHTSCELLPHIFTLAPPNFLSTKWRGSWGVRLFSVALSVSVFTLPGSSPVHCSLLSGLSYPTGSAESIAWLVAGTKISRKSELKEYLCCPTLYHCDAEQFILPDIKNRMYELCKFFQKSCNN